MSKLFKVNLSIGLFVGIFFLFTILNNTVFSGVRLDLTENSLYTLSAGSKEIVSQIDEPINLYFFFSDSSSRDLTSLRAYAKQVKALLQEYELVSDGKIKLHIIDPAPFSEEEDQAAAFGLQAVPINNAGESLYFGLAGTNAVGDQKVIGFFQPDKETFLEYDISKLLQNLETPKKPVIGILSSLKIQGDINMQTYQPIPALMVVDQLADIYELKSIDISATKIPDGIDMLLLVQPKNLKPEMLRAIDQFAMQGGRILAFVDPLAEMDPQNANPMMPPPPDTGGNLSSLLAAWGLTMRPDVVLGDVQAALAVKGEDGRPVRHLAILGMGVDNFSKQDVTISGLESINLATAGVLDIKPLPGLIVTKLIQSSTYAETIPVSRLRSLSDPRVLQQEFKATGEVYPVAVRLTGKAASAFPDNKESGALKSTDHLNAIVIADTDLLSDRMWVHVQDFFGQKIASPWAGNGDFVTNLVDNLVGSSALISVRSRGQYARPFSVVQDLRRKAEASYQASADELQAQLQEAEKQLSALESTRDKQGLVSLSPEQQAALDKFQADKLRIRKQLRNVRHQLDKDIESLGGLLKFLNIAFAPLLLTLLLVGLNRFRLRRTRRLAGFSNES